jgi:hypothetical protein
MKTICDGLRLDREDQQRDRRTGRHPRERERFGSVRKHNHLHRGLNHKVQDGRCPDRASAWFEEICEREADDDGEQDRRESDRPRAGRDVYMDTLSDTNVDAVSARIDCDRTVIREARNLEEHRGLRTHIE